MFKGLGVIKKTSIIIENDYIRDCVKIRSSFSCLKLNEFKNNCLTNKKVLK